MIKATETETIMICCHSFLMSTQDRISYKMARTPFLDVEELAWVGVVISFFFYLDIILDMTGQIMWSEYSDRDNAVDML